MNLIWATRGRNWGFRFLLDGGLRDPLATYELAFTGTEGSSTVFRPRADGTLIAVRFADPEGRTDAAGRLIQHDIVVLDPSGAIRSETEAPNAIWPLLSDAYDSIYNLPKAPDSEVIRKLLSYPPSYKLP